MFSLVINDGNLLLSVKKKLVVYVVTNKYLSTCKMCIRTINTGNSIMPRREIPRFNLYIQYRVYKISRFISNYPSTSLLLKKKYIIQSSVAPKPSCTKYNWNKLKNEEVTLTKLNKQNFFKTPNFSKENSVKVIWHKFFTQGSYS